MEGVAPTLEAKPVVDVEDDLYGPPPTLEEQTLLAKKIEALAIRPTIIYTEPPRKFLTRPAKGRVPFTSDKFDIATYVSGVLKGSSHIYVPQIFRCEFVCNDGTGYPTDFKDGLDAYANGVYADKLDKIRIPEGAKFDAWGRYHGPFNPAFGLIRLVWPSPKGPVHHIIPYLVNTQPGAKPGELVPTIWFLEQYDTTFWWLFNERVRNWHNELGEAMIGQGHSYIRAYVPAAEVISGKKQITYTKGVAKGLAGYDIDLQRGSNGISSETCVPWSMVILKYIMDPKSVGVDNPKLSLDTLKQEDFNEMYRTLNSDANRDTVLGWVQDTVRGGKRRKTHRRRRQTRRKTKRSRK